MTAPDLHWMDASEIAARVRDKTLSPVEVTEACFARIEKLDGDLNAFCLPMFDIARAKARKAEEAQRFADLGAEVVPADLDLSGSMEIAKRNWQAIMAAIVFHKLGDHVESLDPALVACARGALDQTSGAFLFDKVQAFPIYQRLVAWFGRHDLLVTPAVACLPVTNGRLLPEDYPDHAWDWMEWAPFSSPFNVFHNPAASVPAGLSKGGLPIGLQIVGPRHGDALVLQASRAYERLAPWAHLRPPD
ncbi:MAG: hypothetical protein EP318_18375 [Rhodobacteraceae bacterium]|nr:MAG: hypothetical protein EP318_18375 [Paracoccaceae bacterium]